LVSKTKARSSDSVLLVAGLAAPRFLASSLQISNLPRPRRPLPLDDAETRACFDFLAEKKTCSPTLARSSSFLSIFFSLSQFRLQNGIPPKQLLMYMRAYTQIAAQIQSAKLNEGRKKENGERKKN